MMTSPIRLRSRVIAAAAGVVFGVGLGAGTALAEPLDTGEQVSIGEVVEAAPEAGTIESGSSDDGVGAVITEGAEPPAESGAPAGEPATGSSAGPATESVPAPTAEPDVDAILEPANPTPIIPAPAPESSAAAPSAVVPEVAVPEATRAGVRVLPGLVLPDLHQMLGAVSATVDPQPSAADGTSAPDTAPTSSPIGVLRAVLPPAFSAPQLAMSVLDAPPVMRAAPAPEVVVPVDEAPLVRSTGFFGLPGSGGSSNLDLGAALAWFARRLEPQSEGGSVSGGTPTMARASVQASPEQTSPIKSNVPWLPGQTSEAVSSPDGSVVYSTYNSVDSTGIRTTLFVVNPETGAVAELVSIPNSGKSDIAISPDGSRLYLTSYEAQPNWDSKGYLTVVDAHTGVIVAKTQVTRFPGDVAISRDGTTIVVTEDGLDGDGVSRLTVIDGETYQVTKQFASDYSHQYLYNSRNVIISPDSRYAYLENGARVDLTTGETTVGNVVGRPLVVSDDGSKLFIWQDATPASETTPAIPSRITVLDTANGEIVDTEIFLNGGDQAISPDGAYVLITRQDPSGFVYVTVYDVRAQSTKGRATVDSPETDALVGVVRTTTNGSRLFVQMYDPSGPDRLVAIALDDLELQPIPGTEEGNPPTSSGGWSLPFFPGVTLPRLPNFPRFPVLSDLNIPNHPRTPDAQNNQQEGDFENEFEKVLLFTGWIPIGGSFASGLSFGLNLGQFVNAVGRGDRADIADETGDLVSDAIGMIPVGGGFLRSATRDVVADGFGGLVSTGQWKWPWG